MSLACAHVLNLACNRAKIQLRRAACAELQALIVFSRVGVYMRLPGVDVEKFSETVQSGGILGYIDALSGGSISRVGIFSLGED